MTLLKRYRISSALNIVGMAVAFASAYMIFVQVWYDYSFNTKIPDAANIYRMEHPSWTKDGAWNCNWNRSTPDVFCNAVPEVAAAGTINICGGFQNANCFSIKRGHTIDDFNLNLSSAEREGLEVFGIEIADGSLDDFVDEDRLILSQSVAERYDLKAGDVIFIDYGAKSDKTVTVVAIYRDFEKPNSFALFDGYLSLEPQEKSVESNWNDSYFIRLHNGADPDEVAAKFEEFFYAEIEKEEISKEDADEQWAVCKPRLSPLTQLHFLTDIDGTRIGYQTNPSTTKSLLCIAILIILIAFINFFNFFFALVPVRIRSVNQYKIFGAPTSKLRLNFLFETVGLVVLALAIAAVIVTICSQTSLARYISTPIGITANPYVAVALAAVTVLFGIVVSLYPSWYITKFPPAMVVNGAFHATSAGRMLRYMLVGIQYVISCSLIICAMFIQLQHRYMMRFDMGFNNENLLTVQVPQSVFYETNRYGEVSNVKYVLRDAFIDRIKQHPMIEDVAFCANWIVSNDVVMSWGRPFKGKNINFNVYPVSWNFLRVMGIEIVEGRDFFPSDDDKVEGTFIFNEEAARQFDLSTDDKMMAHIGNREAEIAGICKDFHFSPLTQKVLPLALIVYGQYSWGYPAHAYIRTAAGADLQAVREYIQNVIYEFDQTADPTFYEVTFFDKELEYIYRSEHRLSILIFMFSLLSILISIMGVFGLVLFETQYRRREIGIRRVYGASVTGILAMFNRQFLRIVAICSIVAIPLSYIIVDRWLSSFAYRTPIWWWVFALSVSIIAVITVIIVTLRSYDAANENPVSSIQH